MSSELPKLAYTSATGVEQLHVFSQGSRKLQTYECNLLKELYSVLGHEKSSEKQTPPQIWLVLLHFSVYYLKTHYLVW